MFQNVSDLLNDDQKAIIRLEKIVEDKEVEVQGLRDELKLCREELRKWREEILALTKQVTGKQTSPSSSDESVN